MSAVKVSKKRRDAQNVEQESKKVRQEEEVHTTQEQADNTSTNEDVSSSSSSSMVQDDSTVNSEDITNTEHTDGQQVALCSTSDQLTPTLTDAQIANISMRNYRRAKLATAKVYWYSDFGLVQDQESMNMQYNFDSIFSLTTEAVTGKKDALKLSYSEDSMKYCALTTPLGVLSHSTMTYDGNRNEKDDKYRPTAPSKVKQSIQWSARGYDEKTLAADGLHDSDSIQFVEWVLKLYEWFYKSLIKVYGKTALSTQKTKATASLNSMGVMHPTKDQIIKMICTSLVLVLVRKENSTKTYFARFSTRLLRKPFKKEVESFVSQPYIPKTPYLTKVWAHNYEAEGEGGLVLNDIPIYELRDQNEINQMWNKGVSIFKPLDKATTNITDGSLGWVVFELGATNDAGDNISIMGYLKAIVLYSPGTEMSRSRMDAIDTTLMPEAPVFPGAQSYSRQCLSATDKEKLEAAGYPTSEEGMQELSAQLNATDAQ